MVQALLLPVPKARRVIRARLQEAVLFVPLAVAPYFIGLGGLAYLAVSALGGAYFLKLAFDVRRITQGREGDATAKKLFLFSILYLFALFGTLLIERIVWRVMA